MLAFVGAICLLLALLKIATPFDLVTLGLLFMALQLAFSPWPFGPLPWSKRTP